MLTQANIYIDRNNLILTVRRCMRESKCRKICTKNLCCIIGWVVGIKTALTRYKAIKVLNSLSN